MEQVKGKNFDSVVLDICANQALDSDKRTCLTIIENKKYLNPSEITICRNQILDSDKRLCLKAASYLNNYYNQPRPIQEPLPNPGPKPSLPPSTNPVLPGDPILPPSPIPIPFPAEPISYLYFLDQQISKAITELQNRNYGQAEGRLKNLRNQIRREYKIQNREN